MTMKPRTVGIVLGSVFLGLIIALAYNMGGSSQQAEVSDRLAGLRQRFQRELERRDECHDIETRMSEDKDKVEVAMQGLQTTIDNVEARIQSAKSQIAELQAATAECEERRQREVVNVKTSPTADLPQRIQKARVAIAAAQRALADANKTRAAGDKDILRLIFAYIQANTVLSQQLKNQGGSLPESAFTRSPPRQNPPATPAVTAAPLAANSTTTPVVTADTNHNTTASAVLVSTAIPSTKSTEETTTAAATTTTTTTAAPEAPTTAAATTTTSPAATPSELQTTTSVAPPTNVTAHR